jgi:hypothetical protein
MQQQLAQLVATAQAESKSVTNRAEMEAFKARVVGPNGSLTAAMKGMATLSKEERPIVGKLINEAKKSVEEILAALLSKIEDAEIGSALGTPLDPTLVGNETPAGFIHPLSRTREKILNTFKKLGVFHFTNDNSVYCILSPHKNNINDTILKNNTNNLYEFKEFKNLKKILKNPNGQNTMLNENVFDPVIEKNQIDFCINRII